MEPETPLGQVRHHKTIPPPAIPITALPFIIGVMSASCAVVCCSAPFKESEEFQSQNTGTEREKQSFSVVVF